MGDRPVLIAPDTYALFDDDRHEVRFERHLTASHVVGCQKIPGGYAIPDGYRFVPTMRWPKPNTEWIV